jgi:hypothetical protein
VAEASNYTGSNSGPIIGPPACRCFPGAERIRIEIEIRVLKGQCLDRRIESCHRLMAKIDAWQAQRNQIGARITWMFSTDSILPSKIRLLGQAPSGWNLTLGARA